jgi:arginine/ornithine N-succinyltransferase beta subunit
MLLHLVHSQVPTTVASHLRGKFDPDGSAPFWRCFGAHFAPEWKTSTEAEIALIENPHRLQDLADHTLALTAPVLDSLGPVNAASLPAFHMLRAEGLDPNGMYDPIDGGPTLRAELAATVTGTSRTHGRAVIEDPSNLVGAVDALVSVTTVARFRVTRAAVVLSESGPIGISAETADALNIGEDTLIVAAPLAPL